jgi:adenylate kinase
MIFVGGIHGVGKTTICKRIQKELNLPFYSSSLLISEKKGETFFDKKIKGIDNNQDFLLEAVEEIKNTNKEFLLDGHFCLLNEEGEIKKISKEIFYKLKPTFILLIIDAPEAIVNKLNMRDGSSFDKNFVELFQESEIEYCNTIASELKIPIGVINSSDVFDKNFIKDLWGDNK